MIYELPLPPSANRYWRMFRGRMVTSSEAKNYKALVAALLHGHQVEPLDGPVCVSISVYRARRAGDLDNFQKVLLDALQGICYIDDKQVTELHAFMFDDRQHPRVEIAISSQQNANRTPRSDGSAISERTTRATAIRQQNRIKPGSENSYKPATNQPQKIVFC